MIQQRSLLQSDSREVHVGHDHLFFTKASGSKLFFRKLSHRINWKKKNKSCPPVFQLPLGYNFHIGAPPLHPLLAYLTQSAHTMFWSHQFHIFSQGLQAPTCTAQGAPPKFSPRNSMAWHSWLAVGTLQICGVFHPFLTKYPHSLPPIYSPGKFNGPLLYTINWHSNAKSLSDSRMYIYI